MSLDILLVLSLLGSATLLFILEWLSVDLVTLLLLTALVLLRILTPEEAFAGFANDIIIILGSVFVVSGVLAKTGLMDWLGAVVHRLGSGSRTKILLCIMGLAAATSAFISNTTVTAIFLPVVLGLCNRSKISPSQILIPLAYASMLGGTCTLIGTSTNIAVNGYLQKIGVQPFSLFEFSMIGVLFVIVGITYITLCGSRLLPHTPSTSYTEKYAIRAFLSEMVIPQGSHLAGAPLRDTPLAALGCTVLQLVRAGQTVYPQPYTQLREQDVLIVKGSRESLLQVKDTAGIEMKADVKLGDNDLISDTLKIAEAIVMPHSIVIGRTLRELNFRQRFGITVMAIYRRGHPLATKLSTLPLQVGDVLLLQGSTEQFAALGRNPDIWILEETEHVPFRKRRGTYAALLLLLAVLLAGLELVPLSIAFLLAAISTILLKCITVEEAYDFIDWRLIILIGGMTSFGLAMEKTQAAHYLAGLIIDWARPLGIHGLLAGFVLLTIFLTQPMSNAAAALIILPVALHTAEQLAVNPRTFAVLITLAASLSFITPFEPSCLLVYGPGKYRFRDFVISGLPLSLLAVLILVLLVPWLWPLT
jgi:di/tricarboxylate transporter